MKNKNLISLNLEKEIKGLAICRKGAKWINFGRQNNYPSILSALYYNSTVHKACCDFAITAIYGKGLEQNDIVANTTPNNMYTWDELIKNIITDYVIFGSFAFQVIMNKDRKTYSFYHQPISSIRIAEDEVNYYICKNWQETSKFPPEFIESMNFAEDEKLQYGKRYLYVYKQYAPDADYYAVPSYIAAIKAIQSDIELTNFDLKAIVNNFNASGMLLLPSVADEEEKQEIIRQLQNAYKGSENANSLIINFIDSLDNNGTPVQFIPFNKVSDDIDVFAQMNNRTIDRIVSAHKVPNKSLIGMPTDSASLGGDGNILNTSWNLYNNTVAKSMRDTIVKNLTKIFKLNGLEIELKLKELDFSVTDNTQNNNNTSVEDNNIGDIEDDNTTN